MNSTIQRIESFSKKTSSVTSQREYIYFNPAGSFSYLISINPKGIKLLYNRLEGPNIKRRLIRLFLKSSKQHPLLLQLLPKSKKVSIDINDSHQFSMGIISSRRIKLLIPNQARVITIGWNNDFAIVDEIETRQSLPRAINVPDLISVDKTYPYYVTEYIDGEDVRDPIADWRYVMNGFNQLVELYTQSKIEWVESSKAVNSLRQQMGELIEYPIIKQVVKLLEDSQLPKRFGRSKTHGDFHSGNIRIQNETVYILDWEHTHREYLIRDFIFPLLQWSRYSNSTKHFHNIFSKKGTEWEFVKSYTNNLGPLAWESRKWYPGVIMFGLLYELVGQYRGNSNWKETYKVIKQIWNNNSVNV